jgi:hypothetical protein
MAGGVAQGAGPEFKPQYHKNKIEWWLEGKMGNCSLGILIYFVLLQITTK